MACNSRTKALVSFCVGGSKPAPVSVLQLVVTLVRLVITHLQGFCFQNIVHCTADKISTAVHNLQQTTVHYLGVQQMLGLSKKSVKFLYFGHINVLELFLIRGSSGGRDLNLNRAVVE